MRVKEMIWIILSVGIIEFDLGSLMETNVLNLMEWLLIDIPLLLGLYWWITRNSQPKEPNLLGINALDKE